MKFEFANIWKHPESGRLFIPFPALIFNKDPEEFSIALGWLIWGMEIRFEAKKKIALKYATCISPIPRLLTRGKEYEIVNEKNNFFIVKRDDDSIDKVDKSRFSEPFNKWQSSRK